MALDFGMLERVLEEEAQEPQVVEPGALIKLDAQALRLGLVKYEQELDRLVEQATELKINDDATRAQSVNLGSLAKSIGKKIEAWHKEKKAPYLEAGKTLDNIKNLFVERCTKIINTLNGKDKAYQAQLNLENARLRKEQEEANRKLQEVVNEKAKEIGVEPPKVETPAFVPLPRAVKTEAGSISYREHWKWELTDITKVDRKYLIVNDKLVNQEVKGGLRHADGFHIFLDQDAVRR